MKPWTEEPAEPSELTYAHRAHFDNRGDAEGCQRLLSDGRGLESTVERATGDDRAGWRLCVWERTSLDKLLDRASVMRELVERHGGRYDGGSPSWGSIFLN